jgi:hypothetical protein
VNYSHILEHAIESLESEGRHNQADILRDVLQAYNTQVDAIQVARMALRAVRADRPSVHSDEVWAMINTALAKLGG